MKVEKESKRFLKFRIDILPIKPKTFKVFVNGKELKEGREFKITDYEKGEFVIDLNKVNERIEKIVVEHDFVIEEEEY